MSKFKNTEGLEKAYKELEKEFTKKSQKLAEFEKTNYVTLLHNEMDNLLNDYAKRRISDLEAKLTEKNADLHQIYSHLGVEAYCEDIHEQALKEIVRLQQQLAEKERTIATLIEDNKASKELLKRQLAEKDNKIQMLNAMIATLPEHDKELKEICNQDKIEFAMKKLEELKGLLCKGCSCEGECYDENYFVLYQYKIKDIFDKQIEQLKKE